MTTAKPISDPVGQKESSKDYPWWIEASSLCNEPLMKRTLTSHLQNIDHKITPEIRRSFELYSKIPPEHVSEHIYAMVR